jgi:hypothetical protein
MDRLEISMRYDVIVGLVFETERADEDRYDVLDIQTPIEADSPKKALLGAMALAKTIEYWGPLGYPREPVICAIRSVHRESRLGSVSEKVFDQSRLPILVGSITEQQVQLLKSFEKIHLPYYFIHIG